MKRPYIVALLGDLHLGGTTAVCPPRVRLDDGGEYHASDHQRWIYEGCWLPYWRRIDEHLKEHKAHFLCLLNGDLWEGDHHRTMQIISKNPETGAYILDEVLKKELIARKPKRIYVVRGTGAHGGESGHTEEAAARGLNATRHPDTGTWSAWEWVFDIYGVKIDAQHHGRMGRLPHTRHGILHRQVIELMHEYTLDRAIMPDILVRSHNHKFGTTGKDNHPINYIALPCWQLQTEYGYKVSHAPADIGGSILGIFPDGQYYDEHLVWRPERSTVDVIA